MNDISAEYGQVFLETWKSSATASFFENSTYDDCCELIGEVERPSRQCVVPFSGER